MEQLEERPLQAVLRDIASSVVRRMIAPIADAIAEFVRVTGAVSMAGKALRRAFIAFLTRGRGGKLPRSRSARGRAAALKREMVLRTRKRPNASFSGPPAE